MPTYPTTRTRLSNSAKELSLSETAIELVGNSSCDTPRHEVVLQQIMQLKSDIMERSLELGRLLREARDNDYHLAWGYSRFGVWVELASGLDMSERHAYDLIKVVERSEVLGIPDDVLTRVKISSLKAIMSLPDTTDPERVRELVHEAETMRVKDVQAVVGAIKQVQWVYKHLKFSIEVDENVYCPAIERVRRLFGNTMNPDGSPAELSESRAVELIMADFLSGADDEEPVEAEFVDVISEAEESGQATAA
jgi:hypothetical protein